MTKKEIMEILEDEVFTISSFNTEYINTNNGVLNEDYIRGLKKAIIRNAVYYLAEELVSVKQEYPVNDLSKVHLDLDAVIMKRSDLDLILKYIEGNE